MNQDDRGPFLLLVAGTLLLLACIAYLDFDAKPHPGEATSHPGETTRRSADMHDQYDAKRWAADMHAQYEAINSSLGRIERRLKALTSNRGD
jgi:hypothetical protein